MRVLHVGLESVGTRRGGLNRYFEALVGAPDALGELARTMVERVLSNAR